MAWLRSWRRWPKKERAFRLTLCILAAVIGYVAVKQSLAAVIESKSPDKAHALAPNNGFLAGRLAAALSGPNASGEGRAQADRIARLALRQDPAALDAVVTLGLNAQIRGDTAAARHLFAYAEALSRRNIQTQIWEIGDSVARNDIGGALLHYDIALRTSSDAPTLLFPVLASAILDPIIRNALVERLAYRPAWSDAFVNYIAANDADPTATVALLRSLSRKGIKTSAGDSAILIKKLVNRNKVALAWQYYSGLRPSAIRMRSRDPYFRASEQVPTLFDWVPINTGAISAAIQPSGSERGSVTFDAPPSVGGPAIQQVEFLPPGDYVFDGQSEGIDQPSDSSPYWTLRCRGGGELGRINVPNSADTRGQFGGKFTVPSSCSAQILQLILRPSSRVAGITGQIDKAVLAPARE